MTSVHQDWLLPGATKDMENITKNWQPVRQNLIDGVVIKEVRPVLTGYGHLTEIFRSEWMTECPDVDQIFATTLHPYGLSAWHAHAATTDRLFAVTGQFRVVLFDSRKDSPTCGVINEFRLGVQCPMLVVIPPRVWHGVQNYGDCTAVLINAVDHAYQYEGPDHWRVPHDSEDVPYKFPRQSYG